MADKEEKLSSIQESDLPKPSRFQSLSLLLKNKNLMTWLPVILLAIALPITLIVAQNQQSLRNFAAENDNSFITPTITQNIPTEQVSSTYAIEDSYVSLNFSKNNFGNSTRLYSEGIRKYISFLKFDLGFLSGKTITKAILRVKVANTLEAASSASQTIREVSGAWSEGSLNYNNMPSLGSTINKFVAGSRASYYDVDVTSWVLSHVGNTASIAIENASNNNLILNSKESSTGKPTLIITYQ